MIFTMSIIEGIGTSNTTEAIFYNPISEDQRFLIVTGEFEQEINGAGKLTFQITPDNFKYDSFIEFKTIVVLYCDGEEYWRGRVISSSVAYDRTKTLICEGTLNYLLDTYVPTSFPTNGTGAVVNAGTVNGWTDGQEVSVATYFATLIDNHNKQVIAGRAGVNESYKTFVLDNNLVSQWTTEGTADTFIFDINDSYPKTLDRIMDTLVDQKSGYLYTSYANGVNTIHYKKLVDEVSSQWIAFEENMVDFELLKEDEEFWTVLVPFGKSTDNVRIDISGVNAVNPGMNYLVHPDAAARNGEYVYHVEVYDNIETAEALYKKAVEDLADHENLSPNYTIRAIDRGLYTDMPPMKIGQKVRILSHPHNLDTNDLNEGDRPHLSAILIDLTSPERSEFTFGRPDKTLSKAQAKLASTVTNITNSSVNVNIDGGVAVNEHQLSDGTYNISFL